MEGARITVAHHSNGQAGCFLEGQTPKDAHSEADYCLPPPATGPIRVNRANGDFSNTFLSFMLHETLMDRGTGLRPRYVFGAAPAYDWHVTGFLPGTLPRIERQLFYGSRRKRLQADAMIADQPGCANLYGWCGFRGRTRLSGMYEWAPKDLGPLAARLDMPIVHHRWYAEASHTFDGLNGAGLFVRKVDGQDYYNIGFVHRRNAWLVGVTFDLSGYETIR